MNRPFQGAEKAPAIKELIEQNRFVPELFDDWGIAEIRSEEYPGEEKVREATRREKRRLKGADRIGLRVGKIINRYKMAKHFILDLADESFHCAVSCFFLPAGLLCGVAYEEGACSASI